MTWSRLLQKAIDDDDMAELARLLDSDEPHVDDPATYVNITPIMVAVLKGRLEMAELLIRHGADLSKQDAHGNSVVAFAVLWKKPELLRLLLDHGAPVDIADGYGSGRTPLMHAVEWGFASCVKLIVKCGASLEVKYSDGRTVLEMAMGKGYTEIVEMLKEEMGKRGE